MNFSHLILLSTFLFFLIGCSELLPIEVQNNSGANLLIIVSYEEEEIESGGIAEIRYPASNEEFILLMPKTSCRFKYLYPAVESLQGYPWAEKRRDMRLRVQIEADLKIYLVPPTSAGIVDVEFHKDLQQANFPLEPVSQECN